MKRLITYAAIAIVFTVTSSLAAEDAAKNLESSRSAETQKLNETFTNITREYPATTPEPKGGRVHSGSQTFSDRFCQMIMPMLAALAQTNSGGKDPIESAPPSNTTALPNLVPELRTRLQAIVTALAVSAQTNSDSQELMNGLRVFPRRLRPDDPTFAANKEFSDRVLLVIKPALFETNSGSTEFIITHLRIPPPQHTNSIPKTSTPKTKNDNQTL